MPEKLFRAALREALLEEMERDEKIFLIGEDIGVFGGAYRVTEVGQDDKGNGFKAVSPHRKVEVY